MKKLLIALSLLSAAGVAHAGPLDLIFDAPGNFWGRADGSVDPFNKLTHTEASVEQGIRFYDVRWLTFYGGFTWWAENNTESIGYWQAGVKNTTWIPHWIVGIEEQDYVIQQPALSTGGQHYIVAYVSTSYDWNLRKYK